MMSSRTRPRVISSPAFAFSPVTSLMMIDACAKPGDTLADVVAENTDVFLRAPIFDERRAPLLRGLAMELTLAGIEERCGAKIETVIEDGNGGMRVLPNSRLTPTHGAPRSPPAGARRSSQPGRPALAGASSWNAPSRSEAAASAFCGIAARPSGRAV